MEQAEMILTENAKDLGLMEKSNPMYDRLLLTRRIEELLQISVMASLPSPLVGNVRYNSSNGKNNQRRWYFWSRRHYLRKRVQMLVSMCLLFVACIFNTQQ